MAAVFVFQKSKLTGKKITISALSALQMMDGELRYAIVKKTTRVHFLSKTAKSLLKM